MAREWLEIWQLMVERGISRDQAAAVLENASGEWCIKVYHHCSEAPVTVIKDGRQLAADWMCNQCEKETVTDELTFERFKLLPEGTSRDEIVTSYLNSK